MLWFFNTNIIPDEAVVRVKKISTREAVSILSAHKEQTSAIGHAASAEALSAILGVNIPVNRVYAHPKSYDVAISLKLNGRLEEGKILDLAAMEAIGYTLFKITFFSEQDYVIVPANMYDGINPD